MEHLSKAFCLKWLMIIISVISTAEKNFLEFDIDLDRELKNVLNAQNLKH